MDSSDSCLTPIQRDALREIFAGRPDFFLTGGTALAAFVKDLGQRLARAAYPAP